MIRCLLCDEPTPVLREVIGANGKRYPFKRCRRCLSDHDRRSNHQKRLTVEQIKKSRARDAVRTALRNGSLQRGGCQVCLSNSAKTEAHHDDYGEPLNVRWLCRMCHDAFHHPNSRSAAAFQCV